jgi:small-conductance mechanosensitive channel
MDISTTQQIGTAGVKDLAQAVSQAVTNGAQGGTLNHLNGVWSRFYNSLYREAIAVWPHVLTGIFILLVFWIAAVAVKFAIKRMARRAKRRREVYRLLAKCAKVIILVIGLITALGTMGIDVTALVTGLGLTGFAVGLALKDPISNAISGFMVLFYEPFKAGDYIVFSGIEGTVKAVQLRYTILIGEEKRYLIPNANLLTNVITVNNQVVEPIEPAKSKPKTKSRSRKSS